MTAETKPVTWVCKDCRMPFTNRQYAERHVREAHNRAPKLDILYEFEKLFKGLGA